MLPDIRVPVLRGGDDAVCVRSPVDGSDELVMLQRTVIQLRAACSKNVICAPQTKSLWAASRGLDEHRSARP